MLLNFFLNSASLKYSSVADFCEQDNEYSCCITQGNTLKIIGLLPYRAEFCSIELFRDDDDDSYVTSNNTEELKTTERRVLTFARQQASQKWHSLCI
jgi:hypothetical protein